MPRTFWLSLSNRYTFQHFQFWCQIMSLASHSFVAFWVLNEWRISTWAAKNGGCAFNPRARRPGLSLHVPSASIKPQLGEAVAAFCFWRPNFDRDRGLMPDARASHSKKKRETNPMARSAVFSCPFGNRWGPDPVRQTPQNPYNEVVVVFVADVAATDIASLNG